MATKSILKNITIKDKNSGRALVNALEETSTANPKTVHFSKMYTDIKSDDIKRLFGVK